VAERLNPAELKACFDPAWFVRNVEAIFRRAGLVDA
jgi:adenylosuccinate lyase